MRGSETKDWEMLSVGFIVNCRRMVVMVAKRGGSEGVVGAEVSRDIF